MKRHLPGFLVFVLIISVSIAVYAVGRSLARSFDATALPPVGVEEPHASSPSKPLSYVAEFVQYDQETRRLTARLQVDRDSLEGRSSLGLIVAIVTYDRSFQRYRVETVGRVLPGSGEKATVLVELSVHSTVVLNRSQNYYASFGIASEGVRFDRPDLGSDSPIVFVHDKTLTRRGPVILQ